MPARVAVPLPLSLKVTPVGRSPVSVRVSGAVPVVVTAKVPAVPGEGHRAAAADEGPVLWVTVRVTEPVALPEALAAVSVIG